MKLRMVGRLRFGGPGRAALPPAARDAAGLPRDPAAGREPRHLQARAGRDRERGAPRPGCDRKSTLLDHNFQMFSIFFTQDSAQFRKTPKHSMI